MPVSFNQIPENLRVPLVYIEFDNSRAVKGTPAVEYKMLVLGQMLPTGSAEEATPVRVLSADHAIDLFGRGSMLAAMFTATKKADRFMETWCIPLLDDAAGVAATGTIAFTGAATGTGILNCYVAGQRSGHPFRRLPRPPRPPRLWLMPSLPILTCPSRHRPRPVPSH